MPFEIAQFRAQMQGDGARPNLFQVTMPFPSAVVPNVGQAVTKLSFMCHSASLPGSTIGMAPVMYFGRELKLPGNRTFPDWTTTVYNDEDFVVRRAVEQWMAGLNSHSGNLRDPAFLNSLGYTVDARVDQFAKTGEIIKTHTMVAAWPMDLSPVDLGWASNDAIEEFTITWQYLLWQDIASGII